VLGAQVYSDGTPSPVLRDRLDYALVLYNSGKANKILVSGDHGTKGYDEVNVMKAYLMEKGVPREDIFMDHAGFDTYDSMHRAKSVFCVESLLISTQDFHIKRAIYIGRRLGIDNIASYAKRFGLGEVTGIEFPEEASGNVSSREYKKKIATTEYDETWYAGDTIQTAIGQSYSYFTPIQLANYISAIANGGTRYKTHILKSVRSSVDGSVVYESKPEITGKLDIKPENLAAVKRGMLGVVDEGSASAIFENYKVSIGGKTGTAQIGKNVSDNALFVAFAPFDAPEIAVAVVIEHGVKGANAAYVARDIFDKYFEKSQNIENSDIIGELLP